MNEYADCVGINEEGLDHIAFNKLFVGECMKEGRFIINMARVNNNVLMARVKI